MYLDLALFLLVALTALRGLFRGFVIPVVKLTGMFSAVFLAAPLRDFVIADVQPYFEQAIQPELFSKMLWWTCAFLIYVVLAGVAATIVKLIDRQISKDFPGRGLSRALGLMLGAAKGGLIAAVIAFGLVKHEASPWLAIASPVKDQMVESHAVLWTREHQPVPMIWNWMPVVALREHIYDKGWMPSKAESGPATTIPVKAHEAEAEDEAEAEAEAEDEAVKAPQTQIVKADAPRPKSGPATPANAFVVPPPVVPQSDEELLKQIDAKFGTKAAAEPHADSSAPALESR